MSPWMMPSLRLRKSTGCKIDQPISRPGELTTWPLAGTYFYRLFQVVEFEDSAHIVQSGVSWNKLVVSPISLSSPSPAYLSITRLSSGTTFGCLGILAMLWDSCHTTEEHFANL
jgi:hypothetical protein